MDRIVLKAVGLAVLATIVCSTTVGAPSCGAGCVSQGELTSAIRQAVASETDGARREAARGLYENVSWQPLWIAESRASPQAEQVLEYLRRIETRGLRAADYGVDRLSSLVASLDAGPASASVLARIDLSMSGALLRVLSDLHRGRVEPAALGIDLPPKGTVDLAAVVAAVSRAPRVAPVIESVEPSWPGYASLIEALSRYRALAESGLKAPPNTAGPVHPGESYHGVRDLARLLAAFGDLADTIVPQDERFSGAIVDAVMSFQ